MKFPETTIENIDKIKTPKRLQSILEEAKFEAPSVSWQKFTSVNDNFYKIQLLQTRLVELKLINAFKKAERKSIKELKKYEKISDTTRKRLCGEDFDLSLNKNYLEVGKTGLHFVFDDFKIPVSFQKVSEEESAAANFLIYSPDVIQIITSIESDPFNEILTDNFNKTYHWGGQQAFHEFNIRANFELRDFNIEKYAENYNQMLSTKVTQTISNRMKAELVEGIRLGEGIPELSERIRTAYNKGIEVVVPPKLDEAGNIIRVGYTRHLNNEFWSKMVARTETIRWSAEGRINGYRQTGVVKQVIWQATGDNRTCSDCLAMEGTIMTLNEASGKIPLHCLGRCTWVPVLCGIKKNLKFDSMFKMSGEILLKAAESCMTSEVKKQAQKNVEKQNEKVTRSEVDEVISLRSAPHHKAFFEALYNGGTMEEMIAYYRTLPEAVKWSERSFKKLSTQMKQHIRNLHEKGYEVGVDINGVYTWYSKIGGSVVKPITTVKPKPKEVAEMVEKVVSVKTGQRAKQVYEENVVLLKDYLSGALGSGKYKWGDEIAFHNHKEISDDLLKLAQIGGKKFKDLKLVFKKLDTYYEANDVVGYAKEVYRNFLDFSSSIHYKNLIKLEAIKTERAKIAYKIEVESRINQISREKYFEIIDNLKNNDKPFSYFHNSKIRIPNDLRNAFKTVGRALSKEELIEAKEMLISRIIDRNVVGKSGKIKKVISDSLLELPLRVLNRLDEVRIHVYKFVRRAHYNGSLVLENNRDLLRKKYERTPRSIGLSKNTDSGAVLHELGHAIDDNCAYYNNRFSLSNKNKRTFFEQKDLINTGTFDEEEILKFQDSFNRGYNSKAFSNGKTFTNYDGGKTEYGNFLDEYDGKIYRHYTFDSKNNFFSENYYCLEYFANNNKRFFVNDYYFYSKDYGTWKAWAEFMVE
ncbi:MAG: hypothetical protein GF317_04795 [Candidatus Lokiarchaeota archaeon]|nr:hypothetical protein [Candidatus Lokiarchaeota archaeon]